MTREKLITKAIETAYKDNPEITYHPSQEELELSDENAQKCLEDESFLAELENDFFIGRDFDFLYENHISKINSELEENELEELSDEEEYQAIEELKNTHSLYPELPEGESVLSTKKNITIEYSPLRSFDSTFAGLEGLTYPIDGETANLNGDFDNVLELYGISKDGFLGWMTACYKEAEKHIDPKSEFYSKYSPGFPMHSTFATGNKEYHDFFQEIENNIDRPHSVVFLTKMTLRDAMKVKEGQVLTIDKEDVTTGFFNSTDGSGSLLSITPTKDIVIDLNQLEEKGVFQIMVDGEGIGYGVDSVFGLTSEAWTEKFKIEESTNIIKPALTDEVDLSAEIGLKR